MNLRRFYEDNIHHYLLPLSSFVIAFLLFFFSLEIVILLSEKIGENNIDEIIRLVSNPFISLFIGIFASAVIQSSSMITSLSVVMVGTGCISIHNAVPVIMGANIGTTLTSLIVAMSHIHKKEEFKLALSAAVGHNFFNIFSILLLFPLELYFGFVSSISESLSYLLTSFFKMMNLTHSFSNKSFYTNSLINYIVSVFSEHKWILLGLSTISLFCSIRLLIILSKDVVFQKFIHLVTFKTSTRSFLTGVFFTSIIRSSTVSTSMIVPLVATSSVSLLLALDFIIGANIGTTITAFLAGVSLNATALSLALSHVLINIFGAILFFPSTVFKVFLLKSSERFSAFAFKYKIISIIYIFCIFFLLPLILIVIEKNSVKTNRISVIQNNQLEDYLLENHKNKYIFMLEMNKNSRFKRIFTIQNKNNSFIYSNGITYSYTKIDNNLLNSSPKLRKVHSNYIINAINFEYCLEYQYIQNDTLYKEIINKKEGFLIYKSATFNNIEKIKWSIIKYKEL